MQALCIIFGICLLLFSGSASGNDCTFLRDQKNFAVIPALKNLKGQLLSFKLHPDNSSSILVPIMSTFIAECTGENNYFKKTGESRLEMECLANSLVQVKGQMKSFYEFECISQQEFIIYDVGPCEFGNRLFSVNTVDSLGRETVQYSSCYNMNEEGSLYSRHLLKHNRTGEEEVVSAPTWYSIVNANSIIDVHFSYTITAELDTFVQKYGENQSYLHNVPSGPYYEYYLGRGHFAPCADFVLNVEKRSAYILINAHPQWHVINDGNFEFLEYTLQSTAVADQHTYEIYTGAYGYQQLKHSEDDNLVEAWLGRISGDLSLSPERRLPVPGYTWKIVIFPTQPQTGMAYVIINDPHWLATPDAVSERVFCTDVCDDVGLNETQWKDPDIGYLFCCSIADFCDTVGYPVEVCEEHENTPPGYIRVPVGGFNKKKRDEYYTDCNWPL